MTVRSGRSLGFAYKKFLLLKTTKFFRGQPKNKIFLHQSTFWGIAKPSALHFQYAAHATDVTIIIGYNKRSNIINGWWSKYTARRQPTKLIQ